MKVRKLNESLFTPEQIKNIEEYIHDSFVDFAETLDEYLAQHVLPETINADELSIAC